MPKLDSTHFDWQKWLTGSIHDFDIPCRFETIISSYGKKILNNFAIGWTYGENLLCRPKENHIAVMFEKDNNQFWFHLRNSEFIKIFS